MDKTPQSTELQVRTLQLIIGALASGLVLFAAVAYFVVDSQPQEESLTQFGLLAGLVCLVTQRPVGAMLRRQAKAPDQRMGAYMTATLVSAAILEGGAFFNLVLYMLERSPWSLAMAALLWVALLFKTPSRQRVESWLEGEERRAKDEAAFR